MHLAFTFNARMTLMGPQILVIQMITIGVTMTTAKKKPGERSTENCLQQIQEDYFRLSSCLIALDQIVMIEQSDISPLSDLAINIEEQKDQIQHKLYNLAWIVAAKPATTLKKLAIKASILLEQCEEDEEDLTASLTRSLCIDLISCSDLK